MIDWLLMGVIATAGLTVWFLWEATVQGGKDGPD